MKKTSFFGIVGIILLVLFVSGQPYVQSVPEFLPERDSLLLTSISEPVDIENILAEYDSLISAELKASNTVGAAVAIVYNNQVVFQKCFGLRKARTHDSIDENTIFRLASVSKPICGVLAGILADENIICLDDKVTDYIPGLHFKSTSITNELRIKNILSHTLSLIHI